MITIVDYGMGNLGSILNMFKHIGIEAIIVSDPEQLSEANKLILPGVGAFDSGLKNLERNGIRAVLDRLVLTERVPVLGICLGMQLMVESSEEGLLQGLGWIEGNCTQFKFDKDTRNLKSPHMGWNQINCPYAHPLFAGLPEEHRFYFVHSYHIVCKNPQDELCQTDYGYRFTSGVAKGNIMGVQFHPEKSHKFGMSLLKNFAELA